MHSYSGGSKVRGVNDILVHDCSKVGSSMIKLEEILLSRFWAHKFVERDKLIA